MKVFTLGIVGAENSHSWQVASLANRGDQKLPLRVTHLWGETPGFANESARLGTIPTTVKDWRELAGQVDGVMIDHRHGKFHAGPARFFIKRQMPVFIDKPITSDLATAREILALGRQFKTPVITFSNLPLQTRFVRFAREIARRGPIRSVHGSGLAEMGGPHGGIFFHGFHLVDGAIELLGPDVEKVAALRASGGALVTLMYRDGRFASLHFLEHYRGGFHWQVSTDSGPVSLDRWEDRQPYLVTVRHIVRFLKTRSVPFSQERMLAPIAVLEATQRALRTGLAEKVEMH